MPGQVAEDTHQLSKLGQGHVVGEVHHGGDEGCVGNKLVTVLFCKLLQSSINKDNANKEKKQKIINGYLLFTNQHFFYNL